MERERGVTVAPPPLTRQRITADENAAFHNGRTVRPETPPPRAGRSPASRCSTWRSFMAFTEMICSKQRGLSLRWLRLAVAYDITANGNQIDMHHFLPPPTSRPVKKSWRCHGNR
ncbi:hypothetical protein FQA47_006695 [Oryzias melastigma]|uniref:Uncharacterized protein n=1 Tax=Oryzias melastigma TaxID=30732 RepID=A0A834BUT4_ORYME|nr:hypothetical protein FQA47_006695 [Oryzias melastigma]